MKTTIELPDALMEEARELARRKGLTLKDFFVFALRRELDSAAENRAPFRLEDFSVSGEGLRPELQEAGWEEIRRLAYEGHGG